MKRTLMLSCCLVLMLGLWGCAGSSGIDPSAGGGGGRVSLGGAATDELQSEDAVDDSAEQADATVEAEDDSGDATEVDVDAESGDEEVAPVEITTKSVHAGTQGVIYKQTIKASGGSRKYLWEVTGKLPAGLEAKCVSKTCIGSLIAKTIKITGTPTEAGSFDLVVTATDAEDPSQSDEVAYTIVIASKPVEQNGKIVDRVHFIPGVNLQATGANLQALLPAPTVAIEGPKVINVEKAFPGSMVNGLLKEPLEFQIDANGGVLPYKEWKVKYLNAEDYELTVGPGGTVAMLKVFALNPVLKDVDNDPRVGFSVSVTDANGKTSVAKAEVLIKYPVPNINDFTVNACTDEGFWSGEHCHDGPGDLTLTFYRGEKAMVVYNQFGANGGMEVAYDGLAIPMTQVDRITADEPPSGLKMTHEKFTKITLKSAYWWAEYVPAGGQISFLSETDLLEQMTGWEKGHPKRIWHRVGDNIGTTTNGAENGCDLTQEEIDQGYMCL